MPLISPIDIAVLSSPIPLPGKTATPGSFNDNTQQNFTAMTQGSGVSSPIGTGNITTPLPTSSPSTIEGKALESGGSNVGGVVKTKQEVIPTDIKFATQEDENLAKQEEQYEDQVDEYDKAFKGEGEIAKDALEVYDKAKDTIDTKIKAVSDSDIYKKFEESKLGQKLNEFKETGIGQKAGQILDDKIKKRIEKRYSGMSGARIEKRGDRKDDRKARKEAGLKGKEKRLARKAQRQNRRSAYKDFKEDLLDESYADITNLEN